MNKTAPAEFDDVLARVMAWPPDDRVILARKVLDTVDPPTSIQDVLQLSPAEVVDTLCARYPYLTARTSAGDLRARLQPLIGLATGGKPPPSDAEARQWVNEHRRAKYE